MLPLILGSAIVPIQIIITILLLQSTEKGLLKSLSAWLTGYNRQIVLVISLIFGLLFSYQGVSGLLQ